MLPQRIEMENLAEEMIQLPDPRRVENDDDEAERSLMILK